MHLSSKALNYVVVKNNNDVKNVSSDYFFCKSHLVQAGREEAMFTKYINLALQQPMYIFIL